jgi:hypothetical protein
LLSIETFEIKTSVDEVVDLCNERRTSLPNTILFVLVFCCLSSDDLYCIYKGFYLMDKLVSDYLISILKVFSTILCVCASGLDKTCMS